MAGAGYTTVLGHVKDINNELYVNANFSAVFVNLNTIPGASIPMLGNSQFQTQIMGAQTDSNAYFSVVLADNNLVSPLPSQWVFTFCSRWYTNPRTRYCFVWQGTITGSVMDITAQLQAVAALLPPPGLGGGGGIQTINANASPAQIITGTGIATVTSNAGTTTVNVPPQPVGLVSINGDPTSAQQIVAGTGITVTQAGNGVTVISVSALPVQLALLTVNPASVAGLGSAVGTLTLTGPAPAGGALVTLTSTGPAVSVPGSILIPAGSTSAIFTILTTSVTVDTTATITATYGTVRSADLTVTAPALQSLTLNPTSVTGGTTSTATLTLNQPAPTGGVVVLVTTTDASVVVPASVNIAEGQTSISFTVTTSPVAVNTVVTISGTYVTTQSANLTVVVAALPIYGGVGTAGATATVILSGNTATLSTGDALSELQATAEQVGDSWPFQPNGQVVYLLLDNGVHTFTDANTGFVFAFNAPLTVVAGGVTRYLFQSTNALFVPVTPRIQT